MKVLLFIISTAMVPMLLQAQIRNEFEKKVESEHQKNIFCSKLLQLDSVFARGADTIKLNAIKASGNFEFVDGKIKPDGTLIIIFDIIPLWSEAYFRYEREGKINNLKKLRASGGLKITSRVIANEVELPKKTNKNQSYNDFYLGVIKQLMIKNKTIIAPDELDFNVYQVWEKEAKLQTELAIREFREAFIIFFYEHYKVK